MFANRNKKIRKQEKRRISGIHNKVISYLEGQTNVSLQIANEQPRSAQWPCFEATKSPPHRGQAPERSKMPCMTVYL